MAFGDTSVLDNFNRADGGLGAAWTVISGTWAIASNMARGSTVGFENAALWNGLSLADVEARITITTSGGVSRLGMRIDGSFNGYLVDFDSSISSIQVIRLDGGVPTTIGAAFSQAISAGDACGVSIVGSTISVYYKAAAGAWTLLGTRSDSTYSSAGSLMLATYSNTNIHDDFGGGAPVGGGGATYDETVALAAEAGLSPARTLSLSASVTLSSEAGINEARQLDASALVALAAAADWSPASIATMAAALGLDAAAAAAFTGGRSIDVSVDLTGVLAALTAARVVNLTGAVSLEANAAVDVIGSRGIDETLALGAVAGLAVDQAVVIAAAISLAAEGTLTPSAAVIAERVATLAAAAGLQASHVATITAGTTLAVDAALGAIGGRVVTGDVTLGASADLVAVSSRGLIEAIAFDATAGLSSSALRVRNAALALSAVATLAQTPTTTIAAVIALAVQSEITAARRSVMESALVLGATAADAQLAAAIYGRQLTLAAVAALEASEDVGLPPQVIEVVVATLLGSYATSVALATDTITGVSLVGDRAANITLE